MEALDVFVQNAVRNIHVLIAEHRQEQAQYAHRVKELVQTFVRPNGQGITFVRPVGDFE
ncbi:hypothetical protein D1872_257270 [compost metagenome]